MMKYTMVGQCNILAASGVMKAESQFSRRCEMEIFLWLLIVLVFACTRRTDAGKPRADLMVLVITIAVAYFAVAAAA